MGLFSGIGGLIDSIFGDDDKQEDNAAQEAALQQAQQQAQAAQAAAAQAQAQASKLNTYLMIAGGVAALAVGYVVMNK